MNDPRTEPEIEEIRNSMGYEPSHCCSNCAFSQMHPELDGDGIPTKILKCDLPGCHFPVIHTYCCHFWK